MSERLAWKALALISRIAGHAVRPAVVDAAVAAIREGRPPGELRQREKEEVARRLWREVPAGTLARLLNVSPRMLYYYAEFPRAKERDARDDHIWEMYQAGMSTTAIARGVGLTVRRVQQIIRDCWAGRRKKRRFFW